LLDLKEKKLPVEREEEEDAEERLLHFMFLKKAMEEVLVSIAICRLVCSLGKGACSCRLKLWV